MGQNGLVGQNGSSDRAASATAWGVTARLAFLAAFLAAVAFLVVDAAAAFLAGAFLVVLAAFFVAFLADFFVAFLAGPRSRRSASSSTARSSVMVSTSSDLRSEALVSPSVT